MPVCVYVCVSICVFVCLCVTYNGVGIRSVNVFQVMTTSTGLIIRQGRYRESDETLRTEKSWSTLVSLEWKESQLTGSQVVAASHNRNHTRSDYASYVAADSRICRALVYSLVITYFRRSYIGRRIFLLKLYISEVLL